MLRQDFLLNTLQFSFDVLYLVFYDEYTALEFRYRICLQTVRVWDYVPLGQENFRIEVAKVESCVIVGSNEDVVVVENPSELQPSTNLISRHNEHVTTSLLNDHTGYHLTYLTYVLFHFFLGFVYHGP